MAASGSVVGSSLLGFSSGLVGEEAEGVVFVSFGNSWGVGREGTAICMFACHEGEKFEACGGKRGRAILEIGAGCSSKCSEMRACMGLKGFFGSTRSGYTPVSGSKGCYTQFALTRIPCPH